MKKSVINAALATCLCASFLIIDNSILTTASARVELLQNPVAGISIALNNFYAGSLSPDEEIVALLKSDTEIDRPDTSENTTPQVKEAISPYADIAISRVSNYVNVRDTASTQGEIVGKIYNNCAATILETVNAEDGEWYQIKSGSVTGYIKAEYFITGADAEAIAKEVGTVMATVEGAASVRLREGASLESKTIDLLSEEAEFVVVLEEGDFAKLAIDTDLEGYVSKDYLTIRVDFEKAISIEEEQAKIEEEERLKKEAEEAMKELKRAQQAAKKAAKKTTAKPAPTAPPATEAPTTQAESTNETQQGESQPETAAPAPTQAETQAAATEAPSPASDTSEVSSATRNAMVSYAKQFLGNPYVYGGTSLTRGADCSGFTQAIYSNFGISTGRSSRDQASRGTTIDIGSVQPGDLIFYASGKSINHVAMYIGGGQVIHASSATTGIIISPSNYRTPYKAVSFIN